MDFSGKKVVVTGGAQGIGKCIVDEFTKLGAAVAVIDIQVRPKDCKACLYYKGDIGDKDMLLDFSTTTTLPASAK